VSRRYKTPEAFRTALEQKQKQRAGARGILFTRLAEVDLYYRFLDRVIQELGDGAVVVKGGVALEMRLQRARTTLDIDLRASGAPADIYERIRVAGLRELDDFLTFRVDEKRAGNQEIEGEGVIYEGRRFDVQAMLANKPYHRRFGLDVAFGDPMVGPPDKVTAPDGFSFVGIAPPVIPIYPIGTHLAEKLHAYSLPRREGRVNSRLKDLVDIALVAVEPALRPSPMMIGAATVRRALQMTFDARNTHKLPSTVPLSPDAWRDRYPRERDVNRLPWASIGDVHAEVARFLDPVLAGTASGAWDPAGRTWSERAGL
jgi:hypothetical protein